MAISLLLLFCLSVSACHTLLTRAAVKEGRGGNPPDNLDEPERPGSFAPWRLDLLLREKLAAHKWKFILALAIFLFIVVGIPLIQLFRPR
jgi:hypothetical protein